MKKFIAPDYVFIPGISGVGYVEINLPNFNIKKLVSIINSTKGEIIYLPTSPSKTFDSINDNIVILKYNTSAHASDDILHIVYETSDEYDLLDTILYVLNNIFEKLPRTDNADRSAVNVETGTIAVSSLPTLASVTTVSTVSTVGTIQNFAGGNAAGVPMHLSNIGSYHLYDKISIS
jgi:hypothetical protein